MTKKLALFTLAAALIMGSCARVRNIPQVENICELSSPDGILSLSFQLTEDGTPRYALQWQGEDVVLPSRLGFELRGSLRPSVMKQNPDGSFEKADDRPCYSFSDSFKLTGTIKNSLDETWETVWGEEKHIRNHYNELLVQLQHVSGHRMDIRFRLYDDGLGFRYEFPGDPTLGYFVIKEEKTEFAMAGDHTAWWIPGDLSSQEYEYTTSRLSEIHSHMADRASRGAGTSFFSLDGVQTSLQMKTDSGLYLNIHEAALVNYPCMHLTYDAGARTFTSFLTPDAQGWKGYMQAPCHTPWRTVQVCGSAVE
ncbi:MAG: glycoside hydrolase family 97 N-terminal domain-containing protein, partial [Bacteroidales bacterium]|nr:glycoside hydrolase family 97 N-terminal domain-containing protein [Bacteroidales bacterium]